MPRKRLTPEEVERGYNNRAAVPEHPYWLEQFLVRSAAALDALRPIRDIRYGPNANETLDLYVPSAPARGTLMFIHGGYWRAFDKSDHAFVAPAFVAAGFAVAIINYDLCPQVTIAAIVDECRRAVEWMSREGASHGAPAPLVIAGHSAGGHLVAMMYATDWAARGLATAPFVGGVTLSGVHDLSPLVLFTHNADLRLDDAEAARVSPVNYAPRVDAPLVVAVGADETPEFVRQSHMLWQAWPGTHPASMRDILAIPRRHHFNVVLDYTDRESALAKATIALFAAPVNAASGTHAVSRASGDSA
jgi:arylformamidase